VIFRSLKLEFCTDDSLGSGLVDPVDLQRIDLKKMKKENVMRLLAKFMQPFLEK
jgi:hypothetical protein